MSDLPDINTLLPTRLAAEAACVSVQVISNWRRRGHLTPASHDQSGRPLYRLIDIAKAEHATRKKARR